MNSEIICAEVELAKAANDIVEYGDFLNRTVEKLVAIIDEVQAKGINDEYVCSKLSYVALSLRAYQKSIPSICKNISVDVNNYIDGIAEADNFRFPGDITSVISSIVAQFL